MARAKSRQSSAANAHRVFRELSRGHAQQEKNAKLETGDVEFCSEGRALITQARARRCINNLVHMVTICDSGLCRALTSVSSGSKQSRDEAKMRKNSTVERKSTSKKKIKQSWLVVVCRWTELDELTAGEVKAQGSPRAPNLLEPFLSLSSRSLSLPRLSPNDSSLFVISQKRRATRRVHAHNVHSTKM